MLLSIQKLEIKKIRFDQSYEPGSFDFSGFNLTQVSPLYAAGEAELLEDRDGEVRVAGTLSVTLESECDRCLGKAILPLESAFDLYYRPNRSVETAEEIAINESEAEIGFYRGSGIELDDLLKEQVVLLLPAQLLCQDDCKGLCPVCGFNRNESQCTCTEVPADDRWAGLKHLQIQ